MNQQEQLVLQTLIDRKDENEGWMQLRAIGDAINISPGLAPRLYQMFSQPPVADYLESRGAPSSNSLETRKREFRVKPALIPQLQQELDQSSQRQAAS